MNHTRNIDNEIKRSKKDIEMGESLARLEKNRDFRKVILNGYLEEYVLALVTQRSMPEFRKVEDVIESNLRKLDACSELKQYIRAIHAQANHAEYKLPQQESEREAILAESED